ncbi:MAG: ABC transporter permease [Bacteroidota bacterium]
MLIIGTTVVYLQIQHAKNRPLGYNSDGLIFIYMSNELHDHFEAMRNELKSNGAIIDMAEASAPPTQTSSSSSQFDWSGKDPNLSVDFSFFTVGADYGKVLGWNIGQGRDFDVQRKSDSSAMILNQAAVDFMGLKNPVGETIRWSGRFIRSSGSC